MKKLIILSAVAALAGSATAATLSIDTTFSGLTPTQNSVVRQDGSNGPIEALVGFFSSAPTGTDAAADFLNFVELDAFPDDDGFFTYENTNFFGTPNGSPGLGQQVYVWLFDGGFTGSFGSASEYGLVTTAGQNFGNTSINQGTQMTISDFASLPTTMIYGTKTSTGTENTIGTASFQLVPEPSTALLGFLSIGGLLLRRRRA